MTRINKSSPIAATTKLETVRSKQERTPVKKTIKPVQDKISLDHLKSDILEKIDGKSSETAKDIAIKEIINWQFGEVATTDARFQSAYEKLKKQIERSDKYQALLTQLIRSK